MSFDASEVLALSADLAAGAARVGAASARVVRESAQRVESGARAAAPKRTGALAGSIATTYQGDGRGAGMSAVVEASIRYAVFNEYGTSKMAPQPFMGPALEAEAPAFLAAMAEAAGEVLS